MTDLGHIALRHSRSFNEVRQKMLRLMLALGYDEISTSRAITAFSECCRAAVQHHAGLGIGIGLECREQESCLCIEYCYVQNIALPKVAYKLYKNVKAAGNADLSTTYLCSIPLPTNTPFTADQLADLRQIVAMPSREDLLQDLESRNNALSRSEARIAAILESTPDALLIINNAGQITYANSQTERTLGFERQ